MSGAALRRNSNRQGLHDLLRLTAQRSIEDAEETERERRRRAREAALTHAAGKDSWGALLGDMPQPENYSPASEDSTLQSAPQCENSAPQSEDSVPQSEDPPPINKTPDAGFKPNCQANLEEDEGFSDWTLKFGENHQNRPGERSPEGVSCGDVSLFFPTQLTFRQPEEEEENLEEYEMKTEREDVESEERTDSKKRELDVQIHNEKGEEKQTKVTYVSSIFLRQEMRNTSSSGEGKEMTSRTITTKRPQRAPSAAEEVEDDTGEVEVKLEMTRSYQEEERRQGEQEQLWRRQLEAEEEQEELRKKREEWRRAHKQNERKREEEERQQQAQEEESISQMRAEIKRRRMEAAEKMKNLSITEGEEPFSPVSPKTPTFKNETEERVTAGNTSSIIERTESLNRSLKKNNGVKMLPPVLISTIDDRLKQYTHALEMSCREGRQAVADIPRSPEPVASKKSLFEAGDVWRQSATKNLQLKDADGLKVGVAGRISHWVKGNPESRSRKSTSKTLNVKVGDVLYKKNLWESVKASSSGGSAGQGSHCSKRYTFVVTGHGKYEKMPISGNDHE